MYVCDADGYSFRVLYRVVSARISLFRSVNVRLSIYSAYIEHIFSIYSAYIEHILEVRGKCEASATYAGPEKALRDGGMRRVKDG